MKKYRKYLVIAILAGAVITACEKNFITPSQNNLSKSVLYDIMKDWYLWYDSMPAVNTGDYNSLSALLDALILKPTDRWSFVISTDEYDDYYGQGEYTGHGFGLKYDAEGNLRISFTYEGTTASSQGVERGWTVVSINGETIGPESYVDSLLGVDTVGVQNSFVFLDNNGQSKSFDLTKEVIDIQAVLYSDVIDLDTLKIGYLVYQQFLSTTKTELDDVFTTFLSNDIDEVIVDLRYNPGGQVDVAIHLASLLAGDFAVKRTFVKFEHNDKQTKRDLDRSFQELDNMLVPTPERIFFIATGSSASASEMVINGLKGLSGTNRTFDIFIVGDDTYGKPVGSYAHRYNDTTLIPIAFRYSNRLDEGDFFDGLPADSYIDEDISISFGDPEEKLLEEVLHYIENEEFTGAGKKKAIPGPELRLRGLRSEIGAI